MAITKDHIRFSIQFTFHLKKNAAEATAMICATCGENAVNHTICKRWYQKFRQGDFSLEDELRAGRPQKIETDELQALLDINSAQTEKELAEQLGVTQQEIDDVTLHSLCFQSSGKKIFCKIITGDEKWILYDNPKRRKSWIDPGQPSIPKPNIHAKKVLLCI